jgi:hypothetical protein
MGEGGRRPSSKGASPRRDVDVQHSSCDVLRVGCNHLILAKCIQDNKMKFSLLWYETLYPGKTIRV